VSSSIQQSVQQLSLGAGNGSSSQQQQQQQQEGSIPSIGRGSSKSKGTTATSRERKGDKGGRSSNAYMDESLLPPSCSESDESETE
jgi:hypothetical protein